MGLKISELVPKKDLDWDALKSKKVAVDASQMLYQFLASIRQPDGTPLMDSQGRVTSHLMGLSSRIPNLMLRGLKLIFVFDGKPPLLKVHEQEARAHRKRLAEEKLYEATQEDDTALMSRYAKQTSRLSREMVQESKDLLTAFGLPWVQAPSEAEAQAASLCKAGEAWAVSSTDHDCLLYEAPRIITNLTLATQRKYASGAYTAVQPQLIELAEVLKSLSLTQDQLMTLALLVGTDYNVGGIRGIGPKKALKLVQQYASREQLFAELKPDFDWKEIVEVFRTMPVEKHLTLAWKPVHADKVKDILVSEHDFSEERVTKTLQRLEGKGLKNQAGLGAFL